MSIPDIETALGDCPVFAWTTMRATLCFYRRQKSDYTFFSQHFLNKQLLDIKRFICHVNKDCSLEMSTISHTRHPSFRKLEHKLLQ